MYICHLYSNKAEKKNSQEKVERRVRVQETWRFHRLLPMQSWMAYFPVMMYDKT